MPFPYDEKEYEEKLGEKLNKEPLLPVAAEGVTQLGASQPKRSPLRRFARICAVSLVFYFIARGSTNSLRFVEDLVNERTTPQSDDLWALAAFFSHSDKKGHGHGRPIRGRKAEEIFLSVCIPYSTPRDWLTFITQDCS